MAVFVVSRSSLGSKTDKEDGLPSSLSGDKDKEEDATSNSESLKLPERFVPKPPPPRSKYETAPDWHPASGFDRNNISRQWVSRVFYDGLFLQCHDTANAVWNALKQAGWKLDPKMNREDAGTAFTAVKVFAKLPALKGDHSFVMISWPDPADDTVYTFRIDGWIGRYGYDVSPYSGAFFHTDEETGDLKFDVEGDYELFFSQAWRDLVVQPQRVVFLRAPESVQNEPAFSRRLKLYLSVRRANAIKAALVQITLADQAKKNGIKYTPPETPAVQKVLDACVDCLYFGEPLGVNHSEDMRSDSTPLAGWRAFCPDLFLVRRRFFPKKWCIVEEKDKEKASLAVQGCIVVDDLATQDVLGSCRQESVAAFDESD